MPIPRYQLDDRNFEELVGEMLARIPAHTPEWTNPQAGDPGRTLIELFAWLADALLYRVNLIPERQRLEFLRLLNIPMAPARAARGVVTLENTGDKAVVVPRYTSVNGPVPFETDDEVMVFPLTGKVYIKRRPTDTEKSRFAAIRFELEGIYDIDSSDPYVTTALFQETPLEPDGIDIAKETIDQSVWMALLAADESAVANSAATFKKDALGEKIISIGFEPRLSVPRFAEAVHQAIDMAELWQWEMPSARRRSEDNPFDIPYLTLSVNADSTAGLTRRGIIKLALPAPERISLPDNSVDRNIYAGTGNLPPRIDDEQDAARLVTWIRLRPKTPSESLPVRWMGVNAVTVDQRRTMRDVIVATSDGSADQLVRLPAASIEAQSFTLQVEKAGAGYATWVDRPLHTAGRRDPVYELDAEAGSVRFGDGLRGLVPGSGSRIRIATMRAGGGARGNLAPGNLSGIAFPNLKLTQPIETEGGADAETLDQAEKRIPGELAHQRAVTEADYASLALRTPGLSLGRVEVLPKFKPQQRISGLTGLVSVMVLPTAADRRPPNPRPDRHTLARVHAFLEERRPIGVELYVIGCEYVSMGLSVAVSIREGFPRHQTMQEVQDALRDFLWPLSPGGHQRQGWPLGRPVINTELEVVVARVPGVLTVNGLNVFELNAAGLWEMLSGEDLQRLPLDAWQLPELLTVAVAEESEAATVLADEYGSAAAGGAGDALGGIIPIPVVPEICR